MKARPLLWLLPLLTLGACLGLPADSFPDSLDTARLYQHRVAATEPVADTVPLVVPGAAWLEADLEGFLPERTKLFYDLRGRGSSRAVKRNLKLSIESDVADLEALRSRYSWERIDLLGWGYAGGVAIRYALEHPEHVGRLLLVSPLPPRYAPYWAEYQRRFAERIDMEAIAALDHWRVTGRKAQDPAGYASAYTRVSLATFCFDPRDADRVRSTPYGIDDPDPERVGRLKEAIFHRLGPWVVSPDSLAALKRPVLIIHGDKDLLPLDGSREYLEHLSRAQLEVIPQCGRLPWIETPERFFELAEAFLRTPGLSPSTP
jgi:pimeloyl-ACP methyl ester carboxylesterase